jgi:hypothetical protein
MNTFLWIIAVVVYLFIGLIVLKISFKFQNRDEVECFAPQIFFAWPLQIVMVVGIGIVSIPNLLVKRWFSERD